MKTIKYFFITLVMSLIMQISTNAQQVISSAGVSGSNASGSISSTLGELVIDTHAAGSTTITQGFHQTRLTITTVKELTNLPFTISAFPNPTSDWVILKTKKGNTEKLLYTLYNMNGQAMSNGKLVNGITEVSFVALKPATYILKILQDGKEIKTIKIVKQ